MPYYVIYRNIFICKQFFIHASTLTFQDKSWIHIFCFGFKFINLITTEICLVFSWLWLLKINYLLTFNLLTFNTVLLIDITLMIYVNFKSPCFYVKLAKYIWKIFLLFQCSNCYLYKKILGVCIIFNFVNILYGMLRN